MSDELTDELFDLFVNIANCKCCHDPVEILKDFKYIDYELTDEHENKIRPLRLKYLEPIANELIHHYNVPEEYQKEKHNNLLSGFNRYLNGLFDEFVHKLVDSFLVLK